MNVDWNAREASILARMRYAYHHRRGFVAGFVLGFAIWLPAPLLLMRIF